MERAVWDNGALDIAWKLSREGYLPFLMPSAQWPTMNGAQRESNVSSSNPMCNAPSFSKSYPELAPFYPIASASQWMDPWLMQSYHDYWW